MEITLKQVSSLHKIRSVDSLDFSKKILHTAWHPSENIIAVAATNNLYIFQDKVN